MKLSIALAAMGGSDPAILDDAQAIERALRRAVEAGLTARIGAARR
jgi:hypothetical protein